MGYAAPPQPTFRRRTPGSSRSSWACRNERLAERRIQVLGAPREAQDDRGAVRWRRASHRHRVDTCVRRMSALSRRLSVCAGRSHPRDPPPMSACARPEDPGLLLEIRGTTGKERLMLEWIERLLDKYCFGSGTSSVRPEEEVADRSRTERSSSTSARSKRRRVPLRERRILISWCSKRHWTSCRETGRL